MVGTQEGYANTALNVPGGDALRAKRCCSATAEAFDRGFANTSSAKSSWHEAKPSAGLLGSLDEFPDDSRYIAVCTTAGEGVLQSSQ